MPPLAQAQAWSEVLCCPLCNQLFGSSREPLSLLCGHVLCRVCARTLPGSVCPIEQNEGSIPLRDLPSNTALLSILGVKKEEAMRICELLEKERPNLKAVESVEKSLLAMASYLRRTDSERGGSVWSEILSRTIQRKLVTLLSFQMMDEENRNKALKTLRALAERILSEQLLSQQMGTNVSIQLWTAVRARGCQFLGPAMQEDVLKLILLTLGKGALIARKTLVMYVVQMLADDYPQVSKTCVGHVVQLLYRASCFNVIKREGESSLMQLKEEFRTYDCLRREHDSQIVEMAVDAGLRISPDQWSALLYGDQAHRSHMQSIIDKLQSQESYSQGIDELRTAVCKTADPRLVQSVELLEAFNVIHPVHNERGERENVNWEITAHFLDLMRKLLDVHADFISKRNESRTIQMVHRRRNSGVGNIIPHSESTSGIPSLLAMAQKQRFKSKMCRETSLGKMCSRGPQCTYAHSKDEMRAASSKNPHSAFKNFQGVPISAVPVCGGAKFGKPPPGDTKLLSDSQNINIPVPLQTRILSDMSQAPPQPQPVVPAPQQVLMMPRGTSTTVMVASGMAVWNPQAPPPSVVMQPMQQQMTWIPAAQPPPPGSCFEMTVPPPVHDGNTMFFTHSIHPPGPPVILPHGVPQPMQPSLQMPPPNMVPANFVNQPPEDPELLNMRRNEIINRLAPWNGDECDNEDTVGHVSYTVASSVLDERNALLENGAIELPPIPSSYNVINPNTDEVMNALGDLAAAYPRARAGSLTTASTITSRSLCPPPPNLLSSDGCTSTVQADSTTMRVKGAISQPLPTPVIQTHYNNFPMPPSLDLMSGRGVAGMDLIPPIAQPQTSMDAQHFVAKTLDKIVDVKDRLTDGALSSSALSEQLRVELSIASRQMEALDPMTQQSCLIRELEVVERKMEQMGMGVMHPVG